MTHQPAGEHRLADESCPESLRKWLTWIDILDCPCAFEWQSLGMLYRVSMGKCWVRVTTEAACPRHGSIGRPGNGHNPEEK